ncbi:MAG: galactokinase [Saprospiraceae bacterium]
MTTFWTNSDIFENFEPDLVVKSPGRINLIGEHTDYHQGWVFPGAIQLSINLAFQKNPFSNQIRIYSASQKEQKVLSLDNFIDEQGWVKYLSGVLEACRQKDLYLNGMDIIIDGDLPIGAGLSSSSSLTCGFLLGLDALFQWNLTKEEMIKMASSAEYQMGLQGGLMDQTAILYGKKDHLILLDNQTEEKIFIEAALDNHELILFDSKVTHELVASNYNQRRMESESVPSLLSNIYPGVLSLRDVTTEMLEKNKTILPDIPFQRAAFVVEENRRVLMSVSALQNKDFELLGRLMFESHEGLKEKYEVSCAELDLLVDATKDLKEVKGARMMGGGFGGCTINLVEKSSSEKVIEKVSNAYLKATKIEAGVYQVQLSDAAEVTWFKR